MLDSILQKTEAGVRFKVRARPGIKQKRAPRIVDIGDEQHALEVSVSAAAVDGKANKAIEQEIANWLGLRKADVSIKSGQTARIKQIDVTGDGDDLYDKIKGQL